MENKKSNNQSYTYQLATLTEEPEEQKGDTQHIGRNKRRNKRIRHSTDIK
jgi:hypothetical protein